MYNLAVFDGRDYSIPISLKICAFQFYNKQQLLDQIDNLHGVLIYSSEENQNKVIELILSIKRKVLLPIWVRTGTDTEISKKIVLELGVVGNIDTSVSDEEMFTSLKNTFELVYKLDNEKMIETSQVNGLALNALNSSMKLPNKIEVSLTRLEYKMLSLLASKVNQAFTYEEISNYIWEGKEEASDSIKVYRIANIAFHIRTKLRMNGINSSVLRTVRSVGYLLNSNLGTEPLKEVVVHSNQKFKV